VKTRTSPGDLPDVDVPVRPPQTGVSTVPGARGLGVKGAVVLGAMTGVATRARGTGGGRLQVNEIAAPVQDEAAPGTNVLFVGFPGTERALTPRFKPGSGGGARGCDFEEREGAYARTEGGHFL